MRKLYNSPMAEVIEFDIKDVIATSGNPFDGTNGEAANSDSVNDDIIWIDKFD